MDLDARQTRKFLVAGAVPLPRPFPAVGVVWFRDVKLTYGPERKGCPEDFLLIEGPLRGEKSITRAVLRRDVSALFVPGRHHPDGSFRISRRRYARDLERGSWFLGDDVNVKRIMDRLNLPADADLGSRQSILRGIVYVAESAPLLTVTKVATTAGDVLERRSYYCTCEW